MHTSYHWEDVNFLFNDLTGKAIINTPAITDADVERYQSLIKSRSKSVKELCLNYDSILKEHYNYDVVLISSFGLGTPLGVILKRMAAMRGCFIHHYTMSFKPDFDYQALTYLFHRFSITKYSFIDVDPCNDHLNSVIDGRAPNELFLQFPLENLREENLILLLNGLVQEMECEANPSGFHNAVYLEELKDKDLSYFFVESVMNA